MKNALKLFLVFVIFAWTASPSGVEAADIQRSNMKGCAITLAGEIVAGDFEKFSSLAQHLDLTSKPVTWDEVITRKDSALCLDSEGGQYLEARRISQFVHDYGVVTRVTAGAECYSACAFIFMAGRILWWEGEGPRRILNIAGRLGFHAPYIDVEDTASFSGLELEETASQTNLLIADLIRFGSYMPANQYKPSFSLSLLGELLTVGPSEVMLVDTVEEVARWDIDLFGHRDKLLLSEIEVAQTCFNFQAWSLDQHSERVDAEWLLPRKTTKFKSEEYAVIDTGGMAEQYCYVQLTKTPSNGINICSYNGFNGLLHGDCQNGFFLWVPWYYGMPPDMHISALAQ